VVICTIYWAWEDFWFSFSKFCKNWKGQTHLAHALLIFQNKKLCLGIKKAFLLSPKSRKRRKKNTFDEILTQLLVLL